jgi:hypothetical protein
MSPAMAQSHMTPGPFGGEHPPQGTSRLHVTPAPDDVVDTLKQLCDRSSLIIEGTVKSSLLPRQLSPSNLETDAIISVTRLLKGAASNLDISVSQRGGTLGNFTISPTQYAIMQPGEKYLLFLKEDNRPNIPLLSGAKRYFVTGFWSGLFFLNAGKMQVNADNPDALRKTYEGLSEEQLLSKVADAINGTGGPSPFPVPINQKQN